MCDNRSNSEILAGDIVETIREALLVLDESMRVVLANSSFYKQFKVSKESTEGHILYDLGNGQWDIPQLRYLLEKIIPSQSNFNNFEVKHHFESIGEKVMLLNARRVIRGTDKGAQILLAIEDVTEKTEVREKIEESEKKYRNFVESLNSIIIACNPGGIITFVNRFAEALFGYSRDEVIGKPLIGTLIPEIHLEDVKSENISKRLFSNPQEFYIKESKGTRKDGTLVWFSWSAIANYDILGNIEEVLIDGNDITELKMKRIETEEALSRSEQRFKNIFNNANIGILEVNKDDLLTTVNDRMCCMLGYSREELLKMNINQLTALEDREMTIQANEKLYSGETDRVIYDKRYIKCDGTQIWVNVTIAAFRDKENRFIGSVRTVQDISKRKMAEENLRDSEERFRTLADNISQLAWMADKKGNLAWVNKRWYEYTGLQGVDMSEYIRRVVHPDYLQEVLDTFSRSIEQGTPWELTFPMRNASGEYRWFLTRAMPIYKEQFTILMWFGTNTDINELKYYQEQLATERNYISKILDTQGALVAVLDTNGIIEKFNKACEYATGYSSEEVVGQPFWQFFTREEMQIVKSQYGSISCEHPSEYENFIVDRKGNGHYIRWRNTVLCKESGEVEHIIATGIDITDRKNIEEQLASERDQARQLRAETETVLQSAPSALVIFNNDGTVRDMNEMFRQIMPTEEHDGKATTLAERLKQFEIYSENGKLLALEEMPVYRALQGQFIKDFNAKFIVHGEEKWYSANAAPVVVDNKISGAVAELFEITERKNYENQIKFEKERVQTIIENTNVALMFFDNKGEHIISWNNAALHLHGFENNRKMRTLTKEYPELFELRDNQDIPIIFEEWIIPKAVKGEFIRNWEVKLVRKHTGEFHYISCTAIPIRDSKRNVVNILLQIIDITELKEAESRIRRSEEKFKSIYNSNLLGIAFWSAGGYLTEANDAFCNVLGCTPEEAYNGRVKWSDQTPPDLLWRDYEAIEEARKNGVFVPYEKKFIHRDGHIVPVLIGGATLGSMYQGVVFVVDLTQQKEYERSLKKAQHLAELRAKEAEEGKRLLDALMENTPEGISIADAPDGKIRKVSRFGQELLGPHTGETTSEIIQRWTVFYPDGVTKMPDEELPLQKALQKGEVLENFELIQINQDGRRLVLSCNAAPIRNSEGAITGGIVVWHDISDRKRMEEELRNRAQELTSVNRELESFSYSVVHDLKNPINVIRGFVTIILEDFGKNLDSECKEYMLRIEESTDRMRSIIDDILALSRISRQEMELSSCDLSEMAQLTVDELRESQPERDVSVLIKGGMKAQADARLLSVVLGNLLSNAWKYTSKVDQACIEFGSFLRNNITIYFIKDNGAGFDMSKASGLFEPFKRLHTEKDFKGTGVGLAIAERAVRRHGGDIWAVAEPGKGATFYFTLENDSGR